MSATRTPIEKKWILKPRTDPDLLRHILVSRGIEDQAGFLEPNYPGGLHDPLLMRDMEKAVLRLVGAIGNKETIGVFADYDTDGTPGAALLLDGLRQLGVTARVYIPTRGEGYGLSDAGLRALGSAGATVVVTIDLGITGRPYTALARELGIDLIVTDHHVVQADLFPKDAFAVINPKQADCAYPFKELCGGGIIWKLWCALLTRLEHKKSPLLTTKNPEALRRWALDLAAIATICDMVPLIGENRLLAHYGLKVLQKTRRPGLLALLAVSRVEPAKVTAATVGFQIGPRINAPTRMAAEIYTSGSLPGPNCSLALALLLTESTEEAQQLAQELDGYNRARQEQLDEVLGQAEARVIAEGLSERKLILVAGETWPAGIVGLVAGRLLESYGRPTIVLGLHGDEATGSARSIDGFHMVDALTDAKAYLKKYGGHAKAAGLTVDRHALDGLYDVLLKFAEEQLTDEMLGPRLVLEAELTVRDLTLPVIEQIQRLAPHGIGNSRPVFLLRQVLVTDHRPVGSGGQHSKLRLTKDSLSGLGAIGFGLAAKFAGVDLSQPVDLAVQLDSNEWNGRRDPDLHVLDVRPSDDALVAA